MRLSLQVKISTHQKLRDIFLKKDKNDNNSSEELDKGYRKYIFIAREQFIEGKRII